MFDSALRTLAGDLLETMHAAPGIGITAPHIGISLRVVVLDLEATDGARTYVNPEIIWASPEMILHQEGSVSMPGVNDDIERHARVRGQLSRRRRQPADRGIGGSARRLPPARDRSAERDVLDQAAVAPQARAADQAV
jgi:peptide deformylase